jgi:hypothetical protein
MENSPRQIPFYKKLSIYIQKPLGLIGFCLIVSGLFLFAVGVMNTDTRFIFKNEGEWIYTSANLLEARETQVKARKSSHRTVLVCTFQFEHKGGLTRKTVTVEEYERPKLEIAGNTIQIQYKAYNPERAFPKGLAHKRANLLISGALIAIGGLLLLINFFVQKKYLWFLQHGAYAIAQNVDLKLLHTSTAKKGVKHKYAFRADFVANERTYHTQTVILNLKDTDEAKIISDLQKIPIFYDTKNPSDNLPLTYSNTFFKLNIDLQGELISHFILDFFIGTFLLVPIALILIIYILTRFAIATFF